MPYKSVVFMQGDEADKPLEILDEYGEDKVIEYLAQWDDGDDMANISDTLGEGSQDTMYQDDRYVLVYNLRLNYIGLSRIISIEQAFPARYLETDEDEIPYPEWTERQDILSEDKSDTCGCTNPYCQV